MISERDISKLKKNFEIFQDVRKWKEKNIEKIIQISYQYSQTFQDDEIFQALYNYINEFEFIRPPENAKILPEFLLQYSLSILIDKKDRNFLGIIIKSFIKIVPNGKEKAKAIISSHIRSKATTNIIANSASIEFLPYVIASQIINNEQISDSIPEDKIAFSALIAIQKQSLLIDNYRNLIEKYIMILPVEEIINTATASDEGMKLILSSIVPHIINQNPRAYEIIQKLSVSSCPIPAQIVAQELKNKRGINCLL